MGFLFRLVLNQAEREDREHALRQRSMKMKRQQRTRRRRRQREEAGCRAERQD